MTTNTVRGAKFFLVRHDLASFQALPGRIWKVKNDGHHRPSPYAQVHEGDRWVAYAYESTEGKRDHASLIQGFFECVNQAEYKILPKSKELASLGNSGKSAWVIEGKSWGQQPPNPVPIPSVNRFLGKTVFSRSSVVKLDRDDYFRIRDFALTHGDDSLPQNSLLGMPPRCEQELLVVFLEACGALGVSKLIRVGTRFPDLTVELASGRRKLHIELEFSSSGFSSHKHHEDLKRLHGEPACIVCWIDDDPTVKKYMPVFELRDLISRRQSLTSVCSPGVA